MAVQAQYPSNVLLLNRNGQEIHDYSLQPQPGGFLDQTNMVFNNIGNNSRKRGREISSATGVSAPINLSPLQQSRPPMIVDLTKLHNHQPNVVSTGLRLSSGDHQPNVLQSPMFLSLITDDFAANFKRHQVEIDQLLQAQEEHLRRTLAEKRQRHYRALLEAAEESATRRLREKEAEVEKATRRNAELQARAAQLSVEAQVWQAKAKAQEAAAVSLQAQLQQAKPENRGGFAERLDGAAGLVGQADDAESAYVDPDRVVALGPSCKACRKRVASVVLLPCRHLCLCTECDRVLQTCPLCLSHRNSSVEVFLS